MGIEQCRLETPRDCSPLESFDIFDGSIFDCQDMEDLTYLSNVICKTKDQNDAFYCSLKLENAMYETEYPIAQKKKREVNIVLFLVLLLPRWIF